MRGNQSKLGMDREMRVNPTSPEVPPAHEAIAGAESGRNRLNGCAEPDLGYAFGFLMIHISAVHRGVGKSSYQVSDHALRRGASTTGSKAPSPRA